MSKPLIRILDSSLSKQSARNMDSSLSKQLTRSMTGSSEKETSRLFYKRLGQGDTVFVWGEPRTIVFEVMPQPAHLPNNLNEKETQLVEIIEEIRLEPHTLVFRLSERVANNSAHAALLRRTAFENFLKDEVRSRLESIVPKAERAMQAKTKHWTVRTMKSRWGSCRYELGKISIATDLATHRSIYLTLIAFHEVAHMRAHDHGVGFRTLMDKSIPSWRQLQKDLDKEGMRMHLGS